MGRPQLVITVECDEADVAKVPRNIFETVRGMVEKAGVLSADVFWSQDESDDDDDEDDDRP